MTVLLPAPHAPLLHAAFSVLSAACL